MRNQMARHLAEFSIARAQRVAPEEAIVSAAAPAPPTSELDSHDYTIFLLSIAAEIEHALMVQYLFAAYSLTGPAPYHRRQLTLSQRSTKCSNGKASF